MCVCVFRCLDSAPLKAQGVCVCVQLSRLSIPEGSGSVCVCVCVCVCVGHSVVSDSLRPHKI